MLESVRVGAIESPMGSSWEGRSLAPTELKLMENPRTRHDRVTLCWYYIWTVIKSGPLKMVLRGIKVFR